MTLLGLSLAGLRDSPLVHALNITLLALGLGTLTLIILILGAMGDRAVKDAAGIDLVVGAKGSPLQLVLSTVFQADIPTGNIPYGELDRLSHHPLVSAAVPLALGDAVKSFRIVGTSLAYPALYNATLAKGRLWNDPLEAVLGSEAARMLALNPGDHFIGAHGLAGGGHMHAEHPYTVTGILKPTGSVIDRLALTGIESVWRIHESHHHDSSNEHEHEDNDRDHESPDHGHREQEVTAILLRLKSPFAQISLAREINTTTPMQAAIPGVEYARVLSLAGFGLAIVKVLAGILIVSASLSTLIALYTRLRARAQELAVLRLLGAAPWQLFAMILIEAAFLSGCGAMLGLILGHGAGCMLRLWLPAGDALAAMDLGWRGAEIIVPAIALLSGGVAALFPALLAYRHDASHALTGNWE